MSYSENKTYGRKVVKKQSNQQLYRQVLASWVICALVGCLIGCFIGFGLAHAIEDKPTEIHIIETTECEAEETTEQETTEQESTTIAEVEEDFILNVPLSVDLQRHIHKLCEESGVDYALVMAIIRQESNFKPNAISKTNDFGLMQINKVNHARLTKQLGVTDYLDPYQNTEAGIYMLKELFEKYEGISMVLMAYNQGEASASRSWEKGFFHTEYTNLVMGFLDEYEHELSA